MPFTEVFAGIAVRDRDAAIEFYERLLGAPPTMLPNDDEAAWQLTGWRLAGRAGTAVVTLLVDDLDKRLAAAAARGIELGPVETSRASFARPGLPVRTATASRSASRAEAHRPLS
jgi:catechol 2,3-dioxygenase-like lactoylglutathione lyase family enzyme